MITNDCLILAGIEYKKILSQKMSQPLHKIFEEKADISFISLYDLFMYFDKNIYHLNCYSNKNQILNNCMFRVRSWMNDHKMDLHGWLSWAKLNE